MDNKQVFEDQIKPLMDQVLEIAQANKIPFAAHFQTETLREELGWNVGFNSVFNMAEETTPDFIAPEMGLAVIAVKTPTEVAKMVTALIIAKK